jgi:hypothetical protein
MDLKYCERCGNIWIRRTGSQRILCKPCAATEATMDGTVSFLRLWSRLRTGVQA